MDVFDSDDFQHVMESNSEDLLLLGGPDMPEKEVQGQDFDDNDNIEDLIAEIVGEARAPSITDAEIINSNTQDLAQKSTVPASQGSQDHSLLKMSQSSEVADIDKLSKSARKAQKERQQIYERRKMEKIRKHIDKLKERAERNIGKKYLGFGETKTPSKSKEKKMMKTLKQANVSEEERDLVKQLMEYSESSVNSDLSN